MRRLISGACIFLLAATSVAEPPTVTVPEKVYGSVGDYAWFTVTTDGKGLQVVPLTAGLQFFPADKLKNPNEIGVRATVVGEYKLLVYAGNADGASPPKYVFVVFGGVPTPPTPPPGPTPPDPPQPPAPGVDQELAAKFKTALAADMKLYGAIDKTHCAKLGQVYLLSATALKNESAAITFGDLYTRTFNASVGAGIPRRDKSLSSVRGVIDGLGTFATDTKLAGAEKDKAVALWERIGAALVDASK